MNEQVNETVAGNGADEAEIPAFLKRPVEDGEAKKDEQQEDKQADNQ